MISKIRDMSNFELIVWGNSKKTFRKPDIVIIFSLTNAQIANKSVPFTLKHACITHHRAIAKPIVLHVSPSSICWTLIFLDYIYEFFLKIVNWSCEMYWFHCSTLIWEHGLNYWSLGLTHVYVFQYVEYRKKWLNIQPFLISFPLMGTHLIRYWIGELCTMTMYHFILEFTLGLE